MHILVMKSFIEKGVIPDANQGKTARNANNNPKKT